MRISQIGLEFLLYAVAIAAGVLRPRLLQRHAPAGREGSLAVSLAQIRSAPPRLVASGIFTALVGLSVLSGSSLSDSLLAWGSLGLALAAGYYVVGRIREDSGAASVRHGGGLGFGRAGAALAVRVVGDDLILSESRWWPAPSRDHVIPLDSIVRAELRSRQYVSLWRAVCTGFLALLWRPTERSLVLTQRLGGMENEIVLRGSAGALERIRQEILAAKTGVSP